MKPRSLFPAVSTALLVACLTAEARADVTLYDNGPPVMTNGFLMNTFLEADNFTLASGSIPITGIHFWDLETAGSYAGSIYYAIYANNGGTPGAVLTANATSSVVRTQAGPTGGGVAGTTLFLDDITVPAISLSAGSYFLGLHNGPVNTTPSGTFAWAVTSGPGSPPPSFNQTPPGTGPFISNGAGNELAFNLTGPLAIPEPSVVTLSGVALGAAALYARARRRVR
jgi:hypothetical protein